MKTKRLFSIDAASEFLIPLLVDVYEHNGLRNIVFTFDHLDGPEPSISCMVNEIYDSPDMFITASSLKEFKKKALIAIREFEIKQERYKEADKKLEQSFNPDQYNSPWSKGVTMRTLHDCKDSGCLKECK